MLTIFTTLLPLVTTIVSTYLSGKKSRADLDKAINNFWAKRSQGNLSADEREEVMAQRERIDKLIKELENKDGNVSENKVRPLQSALKDLGLNVGKIDGIPGKVTVSAMKEFISKVGVKEDFPVTPEIIVPIENVSNDWQGLVKAYAARKDIPDHLKLASLAQWILESGRGTSDLSKRYLNFGGIKWRDEMAPFGSKILIKVPSEDEPVVFTAFDSVNHFIDGYWAFIGRAPYKGYKDTTTAEGYLEHIKKAGYATDPNYVSKVKSVFTEARKLLVSAGADVEEPERPNKPDLPVSYEIPVIKTLPSDIKFDNQGNYRTATGFFDGLVVHYTVSPSSENSAIGVARFLASKNLGCLVMDEKGQIWCPSGWNWQKQFDDHAGQSSWNGRTSMSKYFCGMEICNWGLLNASSKPKAKEIRKVAKNANQKAGEYEAYTEAQEEALINFCLWQLDVNPEFKISNIVGHDEIAPTRKQDPGGSLSMTMPDFRKLITERAKAAGLIK